MRAPLPEDTRPTRGGLLGEANASSSSLLCEGDYDPASYCVDGVSWDSAATSALAVCATGNLIVVILYWLI
jgi:hypothetical protein